MIVGDNRFGLPEMLDLAEPLGMAVVSVEYRLAPETPTRAPSRTATRAWCGVGHADELGIDPERIVIGGASAGGGLARGTALMARDRSGPAILAQLLLCPMLDDRNDSPSAQQMRGLGIWDAPSNETGWNALLGDGVRGGPDVSPYAAPARAADLSGLPPAFIDVGSAETFRDEDVAYASRIWQAGGARRAARVARRVPRVRRRGPARRDLTGRHGRPGGVAAPTAEHLTTSSTPARLLRHRLGPRTVPASTHH